MLYTRTIYLIPGDTSAVLTYMLSKSSDRFEIIKCMKDYNEKEKMRC